MCVCGSEGLAAGSDGVEPFFLKQAGRGWSKENCESGQRPRKGSWFVRASKQESFHHSAVDRVLRFLALRTLGRNASAGGLLSRAAEAARGEARRRPRTLRNGGHAVLGVVVLVTRPGARRRRRGARLLRRLRLRLRLRRRDATGRVEARKPWKI